MAVAILVGIVVVAMGRGGELARTPSDEPAEIDFESWTDVASYRPPPALLGYQAGATEQAFAVIGRVLADRDAEIAWLRGRLRELQPEGERRDGALTGPGNSEEPEDAGDPFSPAGSGTGDEF
jgi:hypothetical protein